MARLRRFALAGQPQHVIQRGNNRTSLFLRPPDYGVFYRSLATACARYACHVHAYVLMPNHIHLLMTPQDALGIGRVMQSVGRRYVRYFNAAHARTGTLFEGRYRAAPVDTDRYLLTCYRYIELNPVRAGLVARPADYPWSTYRANAFGERDEIITPHEVFCSLGVDPVSRRAAYRALFEECLDDGVLREIRESTNKRWALGGTQFRKNIAALVVRRAEPLPRGGARPGAGRPRRRGEFNGV